MELNVALAMENSGIDGLQARIEVSIPEAKQQMQRHIQETLVHQKKATAASP